MGSAGEPTLVVLAAGVGSRYVGLKQIEPVGPRGEFILDYAGYDALRAEFGQVVFVIRKEIEEAFRQKTDGTSSGGVIHGGRRAVGVDHRPRLGLPDDPIC